MNNIKELNGLKWLLPVLVCLVFSCVKTKQPEGVLSRQEMVRVLMEVYTMEEKVNRIGLKRDSSIQVFDSIQLRLFPKLGVSDSTFKRSLRYYTERPKDIEYIYTALVDSLQLREQRAPGNTQ